MNDGPASLGSLLDEKLRTMCGVSAFRARDVQTLERAFRTLLEGHYGRFTTLLDQSGQIEAFPKLWALFETTMQASAVRFARDVTPQLLFQGYAEPTGEPIDLEKFYFASEGEKIAINWATTAELASLPGLGMVSAARLTSWRTRNGPFESRDAVIGVPGVSAAMVEKFAHRIHYELPVDALPLVDLSSVDSFSELLDRCAYHRLRAPSHPTARSGGDSFISRAKLAVEWVRYFVDRLVPSPLLERRQGMALDWSDLVAAGDQARSLGHAAPDQYAARVYGARYLYALLDLVAAAERRISIQIFFFLSDPGSPGSQLIEPLKAAIDRGVDVRVILDTDLEDDYHGALEVNLETFSALTDAGIPFRRDWLGITTHAKILTVDGRYVLCGSHNLTAGSIYGREEMSLLLVSKPAAEEEERHFDWLWDMYHEAAPCIDFHIVKFLQAEERMALNGIGISNSQSLLDRSPVASSLVTLARESGVEQHRLERLWRIIRLMLRFRLAEADAFALTETQFDAPSEFASAPLDKVFLELEALPPLPEPYRYWDIRYDVIEAAHG
jgi:hypothetical protein